nr:hypothetical protein [Myxococcota bacterium]
MAQAMRGALRLLVRLCAFAFLLVSCHAVVGDYEVVPGGEPDISPITGSCRPGEWTCNREFLLQCTKDGVWKTDRACPTASQCDKTAKTCTVCPQAGVRRCNGARREYCSADRSAWTPIEPCNAADECSPTGCGPCIAGEIQCSGPDSQILQICNANRRWEEVETCETPTLCERSVSMAMADVTWTPRCLSPSCDAGTLRCEGSTLYRCRQSKDGYDRIDICASPALCELAAASSDVGAGDTMCPTGCSPAGSFRCTDNAVEQCASDQTSWSEPVPCPENTLCDSETGECGAPCELGMKRCNAGTLEACTADGMWATEQVCATVALCDRAPLDGAAPRCNPPVCAPRQTRCTGATLEVCNDDRTAFVTLTTCATPELCACTQDGSACMGGIDANGCGVPVCMPLESGEMPLRCNPGDPLQVDICNPSRNGWDVLQVCGAGQFCYPADRAAPCQIECPAPLLCNGAELLSCDIKGPPVHQADCATPTLCECAIKDEPCPAFPNGCGVPQCGGTLPQHQCNGSILQTCQVGRAGWEEQDCGDPALCYPGEEPSFTGGYCAICPTAGVVDCNDDATGIRTCAPDRLGYVSEQSCALGCLERPGPSADY